MKLHPLVTLGILSIAPALADEESAKEMERLISGLDYIGTAPSSAIGTNLDGDSVFTNMQSAITNDQFFLRWVGMIQYESPTAAVATPAGIYWCSSIEPAALGPPVPPAYSALCLYAPVKDQADQIATSGADLAELEVGAFSSTNSYSAIFVPALNAMEGALHTHADNFVRTFWDDGTNIMGQNGYEVHDEGSGRGSSWSGYGAYQWSSAEETASTLNIDVADLTPDAFNDMYAEVYARDGSAADALADTSAANSFGSTGCFLLLISSLLSMSGGGLLW